MSIKRFKDDYYFLSNFSKHGFEYEGIYYPTNEHFFQAMKVFDQKTRRKVAGCDTPSQAKKLGRKVDLRNDWSNIKYSIMKKGLIMKFKQNPELIDRLLDTGEQYLEEGNYHHDNCWGSCYCSNCKNKKGRNELGKSLMELREYFNERKDD